MRKLSGKFEGFYLGDDGFIYHHGQATFPILKDDGSVDHTKAIAYKMIDEEQGLIEAVECLAPDGEAFAQDGLPIRVVIGKTDEFKGLERRHV